MTTNAPKKPPRINCKYYNNNNIRCEHEDESANVICSLTHNPWGMCDKQEKFPKPPPPPPPPPKKYY